MPAMSATWPRAGNGKEPRKGALLRKLDSIFGSNPNSPEPARWSTDAQEGEAPRRSSLAEMLRGSPNTSDSGSPLNSAAFDAAGVEAPSAAPPYSSPPPRRPSSLARCASAELGSSGKAGAAAGGASDRIWGDAKSEVRRITAGGDVRPSMAGGLTARSTASSMGGGDVWRPRAVAGGGSAASSRKVERYTKAEPQAADRAPMRRHPSVRMQIANKEQAEAQAAAEAAGLMAAVAREGERARARRTRRGRRRARRSRAIGAARGARRDARLVRRDGLAAAAAAQRLAEAPAEGRAAARGRISDAD